MSDVVRATYRRLGLHPTHEFKHVLSGFSISMNASERAALLADARVAAVVSDGVVHATGDPSSEAQPGVRRVGALSNPDRSGSSLDVDIAIVDTGIQPNNPDLNVVGGYNCTGGSTSNWGDGTSFGHGTHVAGIAAARNNGSGVEGVAAGARLWAIKVLTDSGLGYWSWIICGLDHVADMGNIEVVNMSLAGAGWDDGNCGNSNYDPLHQAVCRLQRAGVTMVVAAGNEHDNAAGYIPAAYDEVITVSAMADYDGQPGGNSNPPSGCSSAGGVNAGPQGDDAFAKFSNYGADVDLIAPGVCVLSTVPNNRFKRMTGTSMATPHASGGAALYYLAEKRLGHGRPTPAEVRAGLIAAGAQKWRTNTDPDGSHEPALDVSTFNLAADFKLSSTPQARLSDGGESLDFDIWVARLGGFGGSVNLSVLASSLPPGATASVNDAAAHVTINMPGSPQAGTYNVEVRGTSGALVRSTQLRIVVERQANGGPWIDVRRNTQIGGVAFPVVVKWAADAGSYQLERSRDGGAWTSVGSSGGTSLNTTAWPGSRYQYRVRSNGGAWKYGESAVVVPIYPSGNGISLTGNWSSYQNFSSYGEIPVYSSQAGARATLSFIGRSVAWVASMGPSKGRADVYLDGAFVERIDLYASSNRHRQIVFSHSWPGFGSHTFRIDVLGSPSNRPRVEIDTLLIVAH